MYELVAGSRMDGQALSRFASANEERWAKSNWSIFLCETLQNYVLTQKECNPQNTFYGAPRSILYAHALRSFLQFSVTYPEGNCVSSSIIFATQSLWGSVRMFVAGIPWNLSIEIVR